MKIETTLPLTREPLHQRKITYTTCRLGDRQIQIRGELKDLRTYPGTPNLVLHEMVIRLTISDKLIIEDADFVTNAAPFLECKKFVVGPEKLIGLNAGKGFTKQIYSLYGKEASCSHIVTLLAGLAAAIRQGVAFAMWFPQQDHCLTPEGAQQFITHLARDLENSCMSWAKDSLVQKDIKKGLYRSLVEQIFPKYWKTLKDQKLPEE